MAAEAVSLSSGGAAVGEAGDRRRRQGHLQVQCAGRADDADAARDRCRRVDRAGGAVCSPRRCRRPTARSRVRRPPPPERGERQLDQHQQLDHDPGAVQGREQRTDRQRARCVVHAADPNRSGQHPEHGAGLTRTPPDGDHDYIRARCPARPTASSCWPATATATSPGCGGHLPAGTQSVQTQLDRVDEAAAAVDRYRTNSSASAPAPTTRTMSWSWSTPPGGRRRRRGDAQDRPDRVLQGPVRPGTAKPWVLGDPGACCSCPRARTRTSTATATRKRRRGRQRQRRTRSRGRSRTDSRQQPRTDASGKSIVRIEYRRDRCA